MMLANLGRFSKGYMNAMKLTLTRITVIVALILSTACGMATDNPTSTLANTPQATSTPNEEEIEKIVEEQATPTPSQEDIERLVEKQVWNAYIAAFGDAPTSASMRNEVEDPSLFQLGCSGLRQFGYDIQDLERYRHSFADLFVRPISSLQDSMYVWGLDEQGELIMLEDDDTPVIRAPESVKSSAYWDWGDMQMFVALHIYDDFVTPHAMRVFCESRGTGFYDMLPIELKPTNE